MTGPNIAGFLASYEPVRTGRFSSPTGKTGFCEPVMNRSNTSSGGGLAGNRSRRRRKQISTATVEVEWPETVEVEWPETVEAVAV